MSYYILVAVSIFTTFGSRSAPHRLRRPPPRVLLLPLPLLLRLPFHPDFGHPLLASVRLLSFALPLLLQVVEFKRSYPIKPSSLSLNSLGSLNFPDKSQTSPDHFPKLESSSQKASNSSPYTSFFFSLSALPTPTRILEL